MNGQPAGWHWLSERQTCYHDRPSPIASGASVRDDSAVRRLARPPAKSTSSRVGQSYCVVERCRLIPARSASATRRRRGMSLIEVMLATVLLLGAVMALSRIAFLARKHAISAEDRSLSQIHCQNIMEELLAGVRPMRTVAPEAFEGGDWVYMINVQPLEQTSLTVVAVTVDRLDDPEGTLPSEDEINGYRLVRWVRTGDRDMGTVDAQTDMGLDQPPDELDDLPATDGGL